MRMRFKTTNLGFGDNKRALLQTLNAMHACVVNMRVHCVGGRFLHMYSWWGGGGGNKCFLALVFKRQEG